MNRLVQPLHPLIRSLANHHTPIKEMTMLTWLCSRSASLRIAVHSGSAEDLAYVRKASRVTSRYDQHASHTMTLLIPLVPPSTLLPVTAHRSFPLSQLPSLLLLLTLALLSCAVSTASHSFCSPSMNALCFSCEPSIHWNMHLKSKTYPV